MSDTIVHFKKTQKKKKFGNNFCAPELYTLKFITRKLWLRKHLLHHYLQIFI